MENILRERITLAHFKNLSAYKESRKKFLNGGEKDVKYSVALKFASEFINADTPKNLIDSFIELIQLQNPIKDSFDGFNYSVINDIAGNIKVPYVEVDFERQPIRKRRSSTRRRNSNCRSVKEILQNARYSVIYKLRNENRGVDLNTFIRVEQRGKELFELWKREFIKLNGEGSERLLEEIEYPSFRPSNWLNAEGLAQFRAQE